MSQVFICLLVRLGDRWNRQREFEEVFVNWAKPSFGFSQREQSEKQKRVHGRTKLIFDRRGDERR